MSCKDRNHRNACIWHIVVISLLVAFLLPTQITTASPVRDEVGRDAAQEQAEIAWRAEFVKRIADMLAASGAVDANTNSKVLCTKVAEALDEAEGHGIKTQRLMGMYVILRISDKVDPYSVPGYAAVLRNPKMEEADKAHLMQMMRIGEVSEDEVLRKFSR